MSEREDKAYIRGNRDAWMQIYREAASQLGYDTAEGKLAALQEERERAVRALRAVCAKYGDNDWPDNAYLPDVIDKYLERPLDEAADDFVGPLEKMRERCAVEASKIDAHDSSSDAGMAADIARRIRALPLLPPR